MRDDISALIMMATYNGARYISEQLDSIVSQTFKNWTLIIRDDGSDDGTVDIVRGFAERDPRILLLQNDTERHGAYLNFFTIVDYAKKMPLFDYYLFSDQDDIWLDDKIEKMISFAESRDENSGPLLVYGDIRIIDGDGKTKYPSLNDVNGNMSGLSIFYYHSYAAGCDTLMNSKLFSVVPCFPLSCDYIDIMSHDMYYVSFALFTGKVLFMPEICICHRVHGGNASREWVSTPKVIVKRFFSGLRELSLTRAKVFNKTLLTISVMRHEGINDPALDEMEKGIRRGGLYGLRVQHKYKVKRKQWYLNFGFKLTDFVGYYKKYLLSADDMCLYPEDETHGGREAGEP